VSYDARSHNDIGFDEKSAELSANRRQSERHAAAEDQAWIGWWEGRLYRKARALLVDISHGGLKLISESPPPRKTSIWICVAGAHETEWVEGETLEVIRRNDGTGEVRVKFREVCPYAFFEVVAFGQELDSGEHTVVPGDWKSHATGRR
jgi:hypothetical protein